MADPIKYALICLVLYILGSIIFGLLFGPAIGRYLGDISDRYPEPGEKEGTGDDDSALLA